MDELKLTREQRETIGAMLRDFARDQDMLDDEEMGRDIMEEAFQMAELVDPWNDREGNPR